jgi:hypothetical protein
LKTLTISDYELLVSNLRVHMTDYCARTAVHMVLAAVEHPSVETVKTAEEVTSWLRRGYTLDSWLDFNRTRELNVKLALPVLWETYTRAKTLTQVLRAAEKAFIETPAAGEQDAEA